MYLLGGWIWASVIFESHIWFICSFSQGLIQWVWGHRHCGLKYEHEWDGRSRSKRKKEEGEAWKTSAGTRAGQRSLWDSHEKILFISCVYRFIHLFVCVLVLYNSRPIRNPGGHPQTRRRLWQEAEVKPMVLLNTMEMALTWSLCLKWSKWARVPCRWVTVAVHVCLSKKRDREFVNIDVWC